MGYILSGIVSGIISGTGMGGGTVLIYALTSLAGFSQHVAQACNLIFFIPTSVAAIIVNIKNKNIDFKLASIVSITGIIGAIIGAKISVSMNVDNLRKSFGIFLLLVTLNEIRMIIKIFKEEKKEK